MKNMYAKTVSILLFFCGVIGYAQSVSGLVTSDDGPLPGATVVVKGTTIGTTTDFDGNFTINAAADAILVVSFVGFTSQEVPVDGQDQITISLLPDNELDEVVVTDYGSQKKKEITSAVAVVGEEEFNKGTINSATELLQGKAANFIAGPQLYSQGSAVLDYATDDSEIPLDFTPAINELEPNSLREAGARLGKFSFKQFGRPDMDNNFPIVRLGEIYLIRAEALARHHNDWSLALQDTNIIRARAGVNAFDNLNAEDFLEERGREMFQESSRRTDLIRFGKYNDPWWEKPVSEAFKNVMPIPFEQIQASDGSLTQNPGY